MCDYEEETPQKRLSTETETLDTNFFFLAVVVSDEIEYVQCQVICMVIGKKNPGRDQ